MRRNSVIRTLSFFFAPEDSTAMTHDPCLHVGPCWTGWFKTMLWVVLAMATGLSMGMLLC